jgi:hypothetical protein
MQAVQLIWRADAAVTAFMHMCKCADAFGAVANEESAEGVTWL